MAFSLLFVFTWLLISFYLCIKGKVSQFQPRLTGIRIRPYPLVWSAVLGDGFVWCSVRLAYSLYPPCFVAANYCCLGQLIRHRTFGWGVSYHSPRWQVSAFLSNETDPFIRDWSSGLILYSRNSWLTQDRNWPVLIIRKKFKTILCSTAIKHHYLINVVWSNLWKPLCS